MESVQNCSKNPMLIRQLSWVTFLMLAEMTAYEALKQLIRPNISGWESHIVTIIFSTICANTAYSFFFRRLTRINTELRNKSHKQSQKELEATLTGIKPLTGLLTICAACKSIKDDKGHWKQLESYFTEHFDIYFSHGICRGCMERNPMWGFERKQI